MDRAAINELKELEEIIALFNEPGWKLFIEDVQMHHDASDRLYGTGDEMIERKGYVNALKWVTGLKEHYENIHRQINADI